VAYSRFGSSAVVSCIRALRRDDNPCSGRRLSVRTGLCLARASLRRERTANFNSRGRASTGGSSSLVDSGQMLVIARIACAGAVDACQLRF
jgi:hypothetical protein